MDASHNPIVPSDNIKKYKWQKHNENMAKKPNKIIIREIFIKYEISDVVLSSIADFTIKFWDGIIKFFHSRLNKFMLIFSESKNLDKKQLSEKQCKLEIDVK